MRNAEFGFSENGKDFKREPGFQLNALEEKAFSSLNGERIDPLKFVDPAQNAYSVEAISHDLAKVVQYKQKFESEDTAEEKERLKLSQVFEMLMAQAIELNDWMGSNATVVNSSEFDDIFSGIDMIAELDNSQLGLALDVTFGSDAVIKKKALRLKTEIKNGKLPNIKYYESNTTKGPLEGVPKVQLIATRETIDDLLKIQEKLKYLRVSKGKALASGNEEEKRRAERIYSGPIKEAHEKLTHHPFQIEMLEQIRVQLIQFSAFAKKNKQDALVTRYDKTLQIINSILESKFRLKDQVEKNNWKQPGLDKLRVVLETIFN